MHFSSLIFLCYNVWANVCILIFIQTNTCSIDFYRFVNNCWLPNSIFFQEENWIMGGFQIHVIYLDSRGFSNHKFERYTKNVFMLIIKLSMSRLITVNLKILFSREQSTMWNTIQWIQFPFVPFKNYMK